jgi:inner membrane protein
MMARSHVVIGLATWVAVAPLLHLSVVEPVHVGLALVGSLLPDVDHPKSWVGQRTRPISTAIASVLGHRGVTHSAIAVLGLSLLLLHAGYRWGGVSALAVGYLSHLGADMLTPQGLRLAWPLGGIWAFPLCRTGSPAEPTVVLAVVAGLAWWIFGHGSIAAYVMHWWPPR